MVHLKLILFDIDRTLFDVNTYKKLCYTRLYEKIGYSNLDEFLQICQDIYKEQRKHGPFNVQHFIHSLSRKLNLSDKAEELENVFNDEDIIQNSLYPDVEKELQKLSALPQAKLGIFSTGLNVFQRAKITSLLQVLREEHIYINEVDKSQDIPQILSKHENERIYIIDDLVDVLYSIKTKNPSVVTILMKRPGYHETRNIADTTFTPDYTIQSLAELTPLII